MNVLIDSHALIWGYFDPTRLSATARSTMTDPANRVLVSAAAHWEIAIKMSTGKLVLAESFPDFVQHASSTTASPFWRSSRGTRPN